MPSKFERMPRISPEEESQPAKDESLLGKLTEKVKGKVNESRLPTEGQGYESTVGFYGGKLKEDGEGKFVYDMRGLVSTVDRYGDALLRTYDEHTLKDPVKMLIKHPKWFFRFMFAAGTKRYRGTPEEICENARRLGLEDEYENHDWGVQINNPDNFRNGVALQDIYRSDLIGDEKLNGIDRFQALSAAAEHTRNIHQKFGAIGEVLPSDFIFVGEPGNVTEKTVLNIPDIIYNKEKKTGELDKKATDLLDLLMSVSFEELRRSQDGEMVAKAIDTILGAYQDKKVIETVRSYAKRGRLTMQGDENITEASKVSSAIRPVVSQHNKARLNFNKDMVADLRILIAEQCESYVEKE